MMTADRSEDGAEKKGKGARSRVQDKETDNRERSKTVMSMADERQAERDARCEAKH